MSKGKWYVHEPAGILYSGGGKGKHKRHGPIRESDNICCLLLKLLFIFIFAAQVSFGEYLTLTFSLSKCYTMYPYL